MAKIMRNGRWVEIATGPAARKEAKAQAKPELSELDRRMLSALNSNDMESVKAILDEMAK